MVEVVHHLFDGKIFADELLSPATEALPQWRVVGKLEQPLGDGDNVAGANQKTGFTFETYFVGTIEVISNDRFARCQSLRQRAGKRFPRRQVGKAVHDADITRHFAGRHQAGEDDLALETERAD